MISRFFPHIQVIYFTVTEARNIVRYTEDFPHVRYIEAPLFTEHWLNRNFRAKVPLQYKSEQLS